jgi:hypothetical protein
MTDQEPNTKSRPAKKQKKEIDDNAVAKFRRGPSIATKNVRTILIIDLNSTWIYLAAKLTTAPLISNTSAD